MEELALELIKTIDLCCDSHRLLHIIGIKRGFIILEYYSSGRCLIDTPKVYTKFRYAIYISYYILIASIIFD